MVLKKYVYSGNEVYTGDPQYSQIQLEQKVVDNKVIFKLTFNTLSIYENFSTLLFRFYEPVQISGKTYNLYKAEGTSTEAYTLGSKLISGVSSHTEEGLTASGCDDSFKLLELDLSNANYSPNMFDNSLMLVLEASSNFTDAEKEILEEKKKFEFYAEVTDYTGISKSTKVDEYSLDDNAKVLVKRSDGDVFFNVGLISTLHKKYPLSLSLVGGGKVLNLNDFLFPFYARLSMQCNFRKTTNDDGLKEIYTYNIYGDENRYYHVSDTDKEPYDELIEMRTTESGDIYFNELNGNVIYNYQVNNVEMYKIYHKDGSYNLYRTVEDDDGNVETVLVQSVSQYGRVTTYTWVDAFLTQIENEFGEKFTLRYDDNDYLLDITNSESTDVVKFTYTDTKMTIGYYRTIDSSETLLKKYILTFNEDGTLSTIEDSRTNHVIIIDYLLKGATEVAMKLKESSLSSVVIPGIGLTSEEDSIVTQSVDTVVTPVTPVTPTDPIGGITYTYTTMWKYTYSYDSLFAKRTSFTNQNEYSYFDGNGRIIMEMDDYGNVKSYDYVGNTEFLSSNVISNCNREVIIDNNSFELGEYGNIKNWTVTSTGTNSKWYLVNEGLFGKCFKLDFVFGETVKLIQNIKLSSSISKISYYAKKGLSSSTTANCYLTGSYVVDGVTNTFTNNKTNTLTTSWQKYETDLSGVIPSEAISVNIELVISMGSSGDNEIYIDDVLVNSEDRILTTNLIKNGNMHDGVTTGWSYTLASGSTKTLVTLDNEEHAVCLGSEAIKISSTSGFNKMYQVINVDGEVNDNLLLSAFIKCVDAISGQSKMYIEFTFNDNTTDKQEFTFRNDLLNWQVLSKMIVASKNYKKIEVGFIFEGNGDVYIDNVQLLNSLKGNHYHYDIKNNITEIDTTNNEKMRITYDENNRVSYVCDSNNLGTNYFYDTKGRLEKVVASNGATLTLTYDENDCIKTKTFGGITYSSTFNNNGSELDFTNAQNDKTINTYDYLERLSSVKNAKNISTTYGYNKFNQLTSVASLGLSNTMTYKNDGQVETITNSDGNIYSFTYDKLGKLTSISMNNILISSFEYNDEVNDINTGLVTSKIYDASSYYNFIYDDRKRLKSVLYNNSTRVNYEYDNNGNISKIEDFCGTVANVIMNRTRYFTYDINNRLIKVTSSTGEVINYVYDNQQNIQLKNYRVDNSNRSDQYHYDYEMNKYSFENYARKLFEVSNYDIVLGGKDGYGTCGLAPLFNNSTSATLEGVRVYKFDKANQYMKYNVGHTCSNLTEKFINGKKAKQHIWEEALHWMKSFVMWIKPTGSFTKTPVLKFYSVLTDLIILGNLYIDSDGYLKYDRYENGTYMSTLVSTQKIKLNEWNMINITEGNGKYLYLNNVKVMEPVISVEKMSYFTVCEQDNPSSSTLSMPINLALLAVGVQNNNLIDPLYYVEGLKVLKNSTTAIKDKTIFEDRTICNNYELYPLSGIFESNKNNKLIVNYNKEYNPFEYDKELDEYVLSSYKYKGTSIGYDLDLTNGGFFSFDFKVDSLSDYSTLSSTEKIDLFNKSYNRYLFNNGTIFAYIDTNEKLSIRQTTNGLLDSYSINFDEWHKLSVFISSGTNNSTIYLDDTLICTFTSVTYSSKSTLRIGASGTGLQLGGQIKDFVVSSEPIALSNRLSIISSLSNMNRVVIKNTKSNLGFITNKNINGINSINYSYYKDRLMQETSRYEQRTYDYDELGNIDYIVVNDASGQNQINYTYDNFNRIKEVHDNHNDIILYYDDNGNIQHRTQTPKSTLGKYQEEYYGYDLSNKDLLTSLEVQTQNDTVVHLLEYPENAQNPSLYTKIVNNVSTSYNIIYEGKRIKQFGNSHYLYNDKGIRIAKIVYKYEGSTMIGYERHYYELEGSKILSEIIFDINGNKSRLDYNYDINGELVSVEYLGYKYFYIKDALGNINYVVDETGSIMVKYSYDEWGVPTKTIVQPSCPIGVLNLFMYKSYYFDNDTEMYYLNSRFYHPSLRRFITMDDVNYLDKLNVSNLNLYNYSKNNPIMYYDPSGHLSIFVWIAIAIAVAATANDIYQIASGNVYVNEEKTNSENVHIENSYKVLTPWMRYGYSFYLNHFNEDTKDVIQGSTAGVQFEWELHNYAAWLGIGGDSAKHLDVGQSIFADGVHHPLRDKDGNLTATGVMSLGMRIVYIIFGNPISWIGDLNVNGGF